MNFAGVRKILPWLSQVALFVGAVAIVAGMLSVHPLMHRGGVVQYPWQAIAIAQRTCYDAEPRLKGYWYPWRAELSKDLLSADYRWTAGFSTDYGRCVVGISAKTGKSIEIRVDGGGLM
jgi:hypothetical protein